MNKEIKFARTPLHLHSEPVQEYYANGMPIKVLKWKPDGVIVPLPPQEKSGKLVPVPNATDADEIEYEDTDGRTAINAVVALLFWVGQMLWAGITLLVSAFLWLFKSTVSNLPEPPTDIELSTRPKKRTDGRTIIVNQNVNIYE